MMGDLSPEAREEIIAKLVTLEKDKDYAVRFFSGITRYAFGDKAGLRAALDAVTNNKFYLEKRVEADFDALINLVNSTMPGYYRFKTFYWSADE
jgi:hypothetical protein